MIAEPCWWAAADSHSSCRWLDVIIDRVESWVGVQPAPRPVLCDVIIDRVESRIGVQPANPSSRTLWRRQTAAADRVWTDVTSATPFFVCDCEWVSVTRCSRWRCRVRCTSIDVHSFGCFATQFLPWSNEHSAACTLQYGRVFLIRQWIEALITV